MHLLKTRPSRAAAVSFALLFGIAALADNPVITHKFTADPAALVYQDTVYLYTGHDECPDRQNRYVMHEWLCFSSTDMVHWTEHPVPLRVSDFQWAQDDAWASQVIHRDGKFYWYVAVTHKTIPGKAIGVAVSDSPTGPFKDARGSALITNDMTTDVSISWDDIDPTVFIDEDGQAYLFWGNTKCRWVKLKPNMIELDGPIHTIDTLPHFTEAPWIHKHGDWYYLSYAYQFPEKTAYAMSKSITGPWEFKGILNELAGNCNTNHQAIIEYKGKHYFIYHTGGIQPNGGSFRRSVCIDYLYYNPDGTLKRVLMTTEGVQPAQ
ncbi:MAG TPA: glycoside hydrolase family 43 protein [Anaerohalosphaeraceae bacterium]|nr:glycoside hydrolase family 43 protein [Anaerohalosphaeraceae bacterium]HOL87858.1 glycoside hydrolase family 43 protein [Anaerohalosphaeraceae bacterium]HPP55212.1 glycoside hydrolase family 43 protein [Anaerohalosphaeraceae bacterium]